MKNAGLFGVLSLSLLAVLLALNLFISPISPTLWANLHHTNFLDIFFRYYTQIAEWPVIVFAIVIAFIAHPRTGLWVSICYGLEALTVNVLKFSIHAERPVMECGPGVLHRVHDVVIHQYQSFPSGHTAAAFIGFGFIALLKPTKSIQVMCFVLAALVGYSRLYLGQHYLRDVIGGEILALIILYFYDKYHLKILNFNYKSAK